jgi:hypothetical protein
MAKLVGLKKQRKELFVYSLRRSWSGSRTVVWLDVARIVPFVVAVQLCPPSKEVLFFRLIAATTETSYDPQNLRNTGKTPRPKALGLCAVVCAIPQGHRR